MGKNVVMKGGSMINDYPTQSTKKQKLRTPSSCILFSSVVFWMLSGGISVRWIISIAMWQTPVLCVMHNGQFFQMFAPHTRAMGRFLDVV